MADPLALIEEIENAEAGDPIVIDTMGVNLTTKKIWTAIELRVLLLLNLSWCSLQAAMSSKPSRLQKHTKVLIRQEYWSPVWTWCGAWQRPSSGQGVWLGVFRCQPVTEYRERFTAGKCGVARPLLFPLEASIPNNTRSSKIAPENSEVSKTSLREEDVVENDELAPTASN